MKDTLATSSRRGVDILFQNALEFERRYTAMQLNKVPRAFERETGPQHQNF